MELSELAHIWMIVCPLVFLGGLIDAVAGGGGLITLPAYLIAGLPAHIASGTNKCGNVFGTLLSTGRFLKRGDVHIPSAITGAAGALVGAWIGARLNLIMPERMLYYFMLIMVPVMAVFLLLKRNFGQEDRSGELSRLQLMSMALGIGLVIGGYDGIFGPGAGTFLMLAFTGMCRFDLLTASGNTKVANSASNMASLITFAFAGKVMWVVGIPAAVCGIAGNYVGSSLALKGGAKVIRPMFFVVLALLLIRLIYGLFT
ncbi:sulfite exporter TauE/SafE family protein [Flintibacter muris]|uniref:sulfite exporter TauE/SafE family protein n=1 Tax=Flintibacter muris TaxID=2941327 RepID=UPI0020417B66|nr:TSUP family transporter [Flintibacter muris]